MWFISALIMMICIESFNWQHTRRCDCETFEGREEFFEQVRRKGDNQERVECIRRRYVGRPTRSSRDGHGILETDPSTVSSCAALGYILL
jgi:hypothetical protein